MYTSNIYLLTYLLSLHIIEAFVRERLIEASVNE